MGLLDGILGGAVGATLTNAVSTLIEKNGGIQGIVNQFETNGLGGIVKSWVGTGANLPIQPAQLTQAFSNSSMLQDLAAKAGISVEDLTSKLSELLPEAIDKLTPAGKIAA
jgi:uncharacterized protein YidB (DUF937 family)